MIPVESQRLVESQGHHLRGLRASLGSPGRGRGGRVGVVAVTLLLAAACGDDSSDDGPDGGGGAEDGGAELDVEVTVEFEAGTEPVALAVSDDGELLVGERRTGRVRTVTVEGDLSEPIAELAVRAGEDDQRGLLGLAVDGDRIYGAWTRATDGRLVVAEIARGDGSEGSEGGDGAAEAVEGGGERLIWEGPRSTELANGGHLDVLPDGRIVVGVGDLQEPDQVDDPDAPNGKLLALDPSGPSDQGPTALSSGWNNPFAFVVTADGPVWVADNSPGEDPERIGRGDITATPADLSGMRAPSALVELAPGRLGMCGYLDGELVLVEVDGDEPQVGEAVATGCRTGAVTLDDDLLAISDGEKVQLLDLDDLPAGR